MAFAFKAVTQPQYTATRVVWQSRAKELLQVLGDSLKTNHELPIRDLRLRLQVRDAGVLRLDTTLGRWEKESIILISNSAPESAARAANAAIADWVKEVVLEIAGVNLDAARQLRELALGGGAVTARQQELAIFNWEHNQQTQSVKVSSRTQFAELADYVASLLAGKEVYPEAGTMRREIGSDLTTGEARLMGNPKQVELEGGKTASVETYPGRPLPVIHIAHRKAVWAREPANKYTNLSGFALPAGQARALRFEIERGGTLTVQYGAIARQYDLPLIDPATNTPLTAADLGALGCDSAAFETCPVVITHQFGRGEKMTVGRGVTDLDRRLSFECLTELLAPTGFFPWQTLLEIPTHYKAQQDADCGWQHGPSEEDEAEAPELDERYLKWVDETRQELRKHYRGSYHFVLAYHGNLQADAVRARETLLELLGSEWLTIELLALPQHVHGSRYTLPGDGGRPLERARQREQAWQPAIDSLRTYMAAHPANPVRGVLVLADMWYKQAKDDSVNKQAGRLVLNRELGVIVQYLLPMKRRQDGTSNASQIKDFRLRVVNAWRDMAWKSQGAMRGLARKLERSLKHHPASAADPVVLGVGVIRTNRTRRLLNDASFIPYVIELHPATGQCQAALLLLDERNRHATPYATPMQNLAQTIQALTSNGPSRLVQRGNDNDILKERQRLTQEFLYTVLLERAQLHEEVLVLADSITLKGVWPWLADERLDPRNIVLGQENHAEQDFPNATFVRIRHEHAPKVVMDTPRTRIKLNGVVRPAARRAEADLFRLTDTSDLLPSYYSFGTRIFKALGGTSAYRSILNVDEKTGEEKLLQPWTETWQTPNAVEITIAQPTHAPRFNPDDIARLVEALRSEYGHYGSWINAPGPLHFASFVKEYVPDYELEDNDSAEDVKSGTA
jgi:hypothetical protein